MRAVRTCVVDCPQETWWYHRQRSGLPDHHVLVQNEPDMGACGSRRDCGFARQCNHYKIRIVRYVFRAFKCAYAHIPYLGGLAARQPRLVVKQSDEKSAKLAAKPYRYCFFGC